MVLIVFVVSTVKVVTSVVVSGVDSVNELVVVGNTQGEQLNRLHNEKVPHISSVHWSGPLLAPFPLHRDSGIHARIFGGVLLLVHVNTSRFVPLLEQVEKIKRMISMAIVEHL